MINLKLSRKGFLKLSQGGGASWQGCGLNSTQTYISSSPQRLVIVGNSSISSGAANFVFGKCVTCNGAPASTGSIGFSSGKFSLFINNSVIASAGTASTATMYRMELMQNSSTGHRFKVNDAGGMFNATTLIKDYADATNLNNLPYSIQTVDANIDIYVDYFFVANWTSAEPTVSIGDQQTINVTQNMKKFLYMNQNATINVTFNPADNATSVSTQIFYLNYDNNQWQLYQTITNSFYKRLGNGIHQANFTVNKTLGQYAANTTVVIPPLNETITLSNMFNVTYQEFYNFVNSFPEFSRFVDAFCGGCVSG